MAVNSFLRIIREPGLDFSLVKKKMCLCVCVRARARACVDGECPGATESLWRTSAVGLHLPSFFVGDNASSLQEHQASQPASVQGNFLVSSTISLMECWNYRCLMAPDFLWIWGSELGSP